MSHTQAAAPASPGETQPSKRSTPYANCKNLGALRWLLMYGQGPDVRPYALRALLGYLTPALAAIAVVAVRVCSRTSDTCQAGWHPARESSALCPDLHSCVCEHVAAAGVWAWVGEGVRPKGSAGRRADPGTPICTAEAGVAVAWRMRRRDGAVAQKDASCWFLYSFGCGLARFWLLWSLRFSHGRFVIATGCADATHEGLSNQQHAAGRQADACTGNHNCASVQLASSCAAHPLELSP